MNKIVSLLTLVASALIPVRSGGIYGQGEGHGYQGTGPLQVVPDAGAYGAIHYPEHGLQELGTIYEGEVPRDVVKINSVVGLKIHKPYPVKVPYKVPYPVHVAKPYPVAVPQLVKVPHPVPIEVVKNVPVPVEVPKPYPVPAHEYHGQYGNNQQSAGGDYIQGSYTNNEGVSQSYGNTQVQQEETDNKQAEQQEQYQQHEQS